jgi:Lrp/AsnC family leucine-responsive transcriptional regulator
MTAIRFENLDQVDRDILKFIQEDSKITIAEMARKVDLSSTAVRSRLKKLEDEYVKKYMAVLDCRKMGYQEMIIASLRLNSQQDIKDIKSKIEAMPDIKYAYIVTGEYPIFVMTKCQSHQEAMDLLDTLRNLSGVEEVKTQLVMDRIKEDHTIKVPEIK